MVRVETGLTGYTSIEGTNLQADTASMAKQLPKPQAPTIWDVYRAAAKLRPLGTVEAADANEAIDKAAKEYKVIAGKLIAVRRP